MRPRCFNLIYTKRIHGESNSTFLFRVSGSHRAPPEENLSLRIWRLAHHDHHGLGARRTFLEPQVVVDEQVGQHHLDDAGREEAARASMLAGPKVHVHVADARELVAVGVVGAALVAKTPEA
jgi:hypothetical protein